MNTNAHDVTKIKAKRNSYKLEYFVPKMKIEIPKDDKDKVLDRKMGDNKINELKEDLIHSKNQSPELK